MVLLENPATKIWNLGDRMRYNFVTTVKSKSSNREYSIKMKENGLLTCNCPSWIYNQRGNRTCKHIDEIITAGFVADQSGKFITSTTEWGGHVPLFCKNYPENCEGCSLRFLCYTERNPHFTREQLQAAGVVRNDKYPGISPPEPWPNR